MWITANQIAPCTFLYAQSYGYFFSSRQNCGLIPDIACERLSLKTACRIDFTFWYGLDTIKTSDAFDLGQLTKIKMAATAVWRLPLYPMQDIACECGRLKTAYQIDFPFWYGLCTSNTSNIIDLGHSMEIKMASIAVSRLTLYPMQDITC